MGVNLLIATCIVLSIILITIVLFIIQKNRVSKLKKEIAELDKEMLPYTKSYFEKFFKDEDGYEIISSPVWYLDRESYGVEEVGKPRKEMREEHGFEVINGSGKVTGNLYGGCLEILYNAYVGERFGDEAEVYKKYDINPASGCIVALVQLPILFAFLEAINRTPALFENDFLVFQMGTTPWIGIFEYHNYWYIILLILIIGTTLISFRKTIKDQSGPAAGQMKYTIYFMLAMIAVASFTLPAALGIYWITGSLFTILQNLYVERKKK